MPELPGISGRAPVVDPSAACEHSTCLQESPGDTTATALISTVGDALSPLRPSRQTLPLLTEGGHALPSSRRPESTLARPIGALRFRTFAQTRRATPSSHGTGSPSTRSNRRQAVRNASATTSCRPRTRHAVRRNDAPPVMLAEQARELGLCLAHTLHVARAAPGSTRSPRERGPDRHGGYGAARTVAESRRLSSLRRCVLIRTSTRSAPLPSSIVWSAKNARTPRLLAEECALFTRTLRPRTKTDLASAVVVLRAASAGSSWSLGGSVLVRDPELAAVREAKSTELDARDACARGKVKREVTHLPGELQGD